MPNIHGGKENLEAIEFFQKLNTTIFAAHPDVLMIAEESTAWPKVTYPVDEGGTGLQLQVEHGLDERHLPLHQAGPPISASSTTGTSPSL